MIRARLFAAPAGFLVIAVLVVTQWSPLRHLDLTVARDLNDAVAPHPALVTALKIVSEVGQPATWQVLSALVAVVLYRRGEPRTAVFTVATVVLASLVNNIVKLIVRRDRPTVPDVLTHASGMSFPSGHATASLTGVSVLLLVLLPRARESARRRLRVAGVAVGVVVVAAIGFSRLALGVHYVSDVTAGWLLATSWLLLCSWLARRHGRPGRLRPAVAASAAPGRPPAPPA